MGLVETFTDVEGSQGRENQSLNGTGKQTKEHGWKWDKYWDQEGQHCHNQFIGKNITEQTERKRDR